MNDELGFRKLWRKWKIVAKAVGDAQARLLLMGVYLLSWPIALVVKLKRRPFDLASGASGWWTRKDQESELEKQY